jgi:hypothetical protein
MIFKLTNHVKEEMVRRSISWTLLEQVLNNPQQIVIEKGNLKAYQSLSLSMMAERSCFGLLLMIP